MLKYLVIFIFGLFGDISQICYAEERNFEKNGISYSWESQPDPFENKRVFLDAFIKCYKEIPLEILRKASREAVANWLSESFDETYLDFESSETLFWLSGKINDQVVAFLVIDTTNYPEEIYLALLAVDPTYQGKGIASVMIKALFDQFSDCTKFVVITRCANEEAKGLYKALGFTPSLYIHEGYSRELYTGFEYRVAK
jgi:ribosomal protein S18 acetylase RimI-like enzyme